MNLALYETITQKEDALVGTLTATKKYKLSFVVENKVQMKILVKDDTTNQMLKRLNNSMFFKAGSYYFEVSSRNSANLIFNINKIEGAIVNIVFEEVTE